MRESEAKLLRGLLPYLILKVAEAQSFHGYELITVMRRRFNAYFGPSTIYPLLNFLESEQLLTSQWITGARLRPRKVYTITADGRTMVEACTSTIHAVSTFSGQVQRQPQKPERHNIITLEQ